MSDLQSKSHQTLKVRRECHESQDSTPKDDTCTSDLGDTVPLKTESQGVFTNEITEIWWSVRISKYFTSM
jgi:hypothetical protein